jgi:membrane protease YdiL (CAAX protease family)
MGWLSWWYRRRYIRRVVVPTDADNLLQGLYYVVLNAPAEELFFRGVLLGWLQSVVGTPAAWAVSTLLFGLYHIPARWGRMAVMGTTVAGGLFGALFLLTGSLLLPTLVHACATCGFLSTGPWIAYRVQARRVRRTVTA